MTERSREETLRDCDLVMKGGITSGVVYPQAVLALKDKYRFRSIGGGSVGAVAAALTAAAELGRESERKSSGFRGLETEQKKLRQPGFLLDVFQPSKNTRPLMDALLKLKSLLDLGRSGQRGNAWFFRKSKPILRSNFPKAYCNGRRVGAAAGVAVGVLSSVVLSIVVGIFLYLSFLYLSFFAGQTGSSLGGWSLAFPLLLFVPVLVLGALFSLAGGWLGGPVGGAYGLFRVLTREMPEKNFYGLCIGSGDPGPGKHPLLTDWLSGLLDELADLESKEIEGPLTFGHLKNKNFPGKKAGESTITLRMLTTNLNHQEPYVFPKETNTFLFKREDMDRFFPGYVTEYMVKKGEEVARSTCVRPPVGYHFLPRGEDLPVIVPVRMGLSFPVLLSAVPLYTVKESAWDRYRENPQGKFDPEKDLQLNLFSDGGICSNFPIHFFDGWLPGRPTFGINLTSTPEGERGDGFSVGDVELPGAGSRGPDTRIKHIVNPAEPWLPKPDDPDSRKWKRFGGLVGFFMAILNSAMNYRDNMQSRLPSYQERVVQIPLGPEEGGLNLGMETGVIESMELRGKKAGELLRDGFDFKRHRWVRLRVLLNELETRLENIHEALASVAAERLVDEQLDGGFPYPFPDKQEERSEDAKELLRRLYELIEHLKSSDNRFPPVPDEDPQPALRITPDV